MAEKSKRLPNFTSAEENLLLQLVEEHAGTLENKRTDATSWEEKKKVWEAIDRQFEAQIGIKRGPKNLKEKYENLKRKARRNLGEERREIYRTGGGEYRHRSDPSTERLAALMGNSATGLSNTCDNDVIPYEVETVVEALDESMASFCVEPVGEATEAVEKNTSANWSFILSQKKSEKLATKKSLKQKEKSDSQQHFWQEESTRAAEKHEWARQKHDFELRCAKEKHDFELKCAKEKHEFEMKESELRLKLLELKIDEEEIKNLQII